MANVNVSYEEMRAQAGKLEQARNDIETQLHTLKTQVDSLVTSGFVTDNASKSFQASYETFNSGVKETLMGLNGMSTYLNKAAQTFEDADAQLASSLGS